MASSSSSSRFFALDSCMASFARACASVASVALVWAVTAARAALPSAALAAFCAAFKAATASGCTDQRSDNGDDRDLRAGVQPGEVWCDLVRVAPVDFAPLVFESSGRIGASSLRVVRRLAARSALDRGVSALREQRRWLELLTLRLQLDQANILLNG